MSNDKDWKELELWSKQKEAEKIEEYGVDIEKLEKDTTKINKVTTKINKVIRGTTIFSYCIFAIIAILLFIIAITSFIDVNNRLKSFPPDKPIDIYELNIMK